MKKKGSIMLIIIMAIVGAYLIYNHFNKDKNINNNNKNFNEEYSLVDKDNVYRYINIDEVLDTFNKSGIIFMGFKENIWSNYYAKYLNEVAKENNIKEILYYDIKKDRQTNNIKYKKLINLLEKYLMMNDEGNLYISVPYLVIIKDGKIMYTDNETSIINGNTTPSLYWNQNNIDIFHIHSFILLFSSRSSLHSYKYFTFLSYFNLY